MIRKTLILIFSLLAFILLSVGISYFINHFFQERYRKITIARDTTYVLGPTFPDGYIDYLAALNNQFSQGVTPENNAAVPLYLATNPKDFYRGWILDAYLAALGVKAPPNPDDTYISFADFMFNGKLKSATQPQEIRNHESEFHQAWTDQIESRYKAPWTRDQDADAYAWLQRNAKPLQLIVEASRREHCFFPSIDKPGLGTTLQAHVANLLGIRNFSQLLATRAMLSLGNHDFPGWREDMLAQQRLGRQLAHAPNLIQGLVGLAIIQQANDQINAALPYLSSEQVQTILNDLHALPAPADLLDCQDQCIRLETIAEISTMARFGSAAIYIDDDGTTPLPAPESLGFQPAIHFDDLLREDNKLFDRQIAAGRLPLYSQRRTALAAFDSDCAASAAKITGTSSTDAIRRLIYPTESTSHFLIVQDKSRQNQRLTQIALQLIVYRAGHGAYPASLKEIPDAPTDLFADEAPLHYVPESRLIYSVGPNQRDDKGVYVEPKRSGNLLTPTPPQDLPDDIFVKLPPLPPSPLSP